jgi:hypothetical protein
MKDGITSSGGLAVVIASALVASACALPLDAGTQAGANSGATAASATSVESSSNPESDTETEAALAILERMSAHLASREAFRFHAEVEYDAVQPSGQRIEFGNSREVAVRRPDRLRVDVFDRDGTSEILSYDGTDVWIASPSRNAYSRMPQAGMLEQVLEQLASEYDTPAQLAELIDPDLYRHLRPAIESGSRVGLVRLDGRFCEQLAFRTDKVDFQLFVERGATPLPRRLVIDYRNEPGKPQFRASLGDWDLAPELPDTHFHVSPPIGAQRVPFDELLELMMAAPDALPEPGDTP